MVGTTLRIRFRALSSALIDQSQVSNRHGGGLSGGIDGGLADKILDLIRANNTITVMDISEALETSKRTVEREMKKLRDDKRIKREGGNRYGHWEIF